MDIIPKAKEFILQGLSIAVKEEFSPYIVYAHACHESNYFKRIIGIANVWGIKKSHDWQGNVIDIVTHEYVDGKPVEIVQVFKDYPRWDCAVADYCALIKRLYPEAYQGRLDPTIYFNALVLYKYKYATDPKYTLKCLEVYDTIAKDKELEELINNTSWTNHNDPTGQG